LSNSSMHFMRHLLYKVIKVETALYSHGPAIYKAFMNQLGILQPSSFYGFSHGLDECYSEFL